MSRSANKKQTGTKSAAAKPNEKKISTVTIILVIQLIVMAVLIIIMSRAIARVTRENALNHMATITDERAQIIANYVTNSEKTLRSFSKASQVKDLLELTKTMDLHTLVDKEDPNYNPSADPQAQAVLKAAQKYTIDFGNDVDNLEGFWIGTWDTLVLTHTNENVVGMTTRPDPVKLEQLRSSMIKGDNGLYNAGIIISPASKKQILSMYIEVKDEKGNPIGLVGLGIFTDQLINNLDSMTIKGMNDTFYSMVNSADRNYIFHSNKDLVTKQATNDQIEKLLQNPPSQPGSFEYKQNGKDYISSYTYMKEYGWLMMLDAPRSEVYSMTTQMRIFIFIFGVLILGLILIFSFLNKRQEEANRKLSKQIQKTEKTKESLSAAMFRDVLTNVQNRVSFSMDLEDKTAAKEKPYYFVMFNILGFSGINTTYGNDSGDAILVNTAETLASCFPDGVIYRTGSDEFVVSIEAEDDSNTAFQKVQREVKDAQGKLMGPQQTPGGAVVAPYKIIMVKKTGQINSSVIAALKNIGNQQSGKTMFGQIQCTELK